MRVLLTATLVLVLSACAGQNADTIVADFDESTGESFTRLKEPLRFATARPGLSSVGKDYLLVAPVTVAGSAKSGQYLWFAIGTTLDRPLSGAPQPGFDRILLVVDGTHMTFDLVDWQETAKTQPFDAPVLITRSFSSRVTQSQLNKIANATVVSAYVTNPEHRSPEYELLRGELSDWLDF